MTQEGRRQALVLSLLKTPNSMGAMSACPRNSSYSIRAGLVPKFTPSLQGSKGEVSTTNIPPDPIRKGVKENMIVGGNNPFYFQILKRCACVYIYMPGVL